MVGEEIPCSSALPLSLAQLVSSQGFNLRRMMPQSTQLPIRKFIPALLWPNQSASLTSPAHLKINMTMKNWSIISKLTLAHQHLTSRWHSNLCTRLRRRYQCSLTSASPSPSSSSFYTCSTQYSRSSSQAAIYINYSILIKRLDRRNLVDLCRTEKFQAQVDHQACAKNVIS